MRPADAIGPSAGIIASGFARWRRSAGLFFLLARIFLAAFSLTAFAALLAVGRAILLAKCVPTGDAMGMDSSSCRWFRSLPAKARPGIFAPPNRHRPAAVEA